MQRRWLGFLIAAALLSGSSWAQVSHIKRVIKGRDFFFRTAFYCAGFQHRLEASFDGQDYILWLDGKPVFLAHEEIYSPCGACWGGKILIAFGLERRLYLLSDGRLTPLPLRIKGAVQLFPSFVRKDGRTYLQWYELRRGRLEAFRVDLSSGKIEGSAGGPLDYKPPVPPFWYNYELDANRYIAFGDSITYGCGYGTCEHDPPIGYPPRLEKILDAELGPSKVVNRAVPGEDTFDAVARIEQVLQEEQARYILIMEGTNDVVHIEYPLSATEENLRTLIETSMRFGTYPLIATIIPRKDWFWEAPYFHHKLEMVVKVARKLAREYNIPLADFYAMYMNYEGDWKELLSDGNHPSIKGYQMMAEEWARQIKTIPPYPPRPYEVVEEGPFLRISWLENEESDLAGYMLCYDQVCVDVGRRLQIRVERAKAAGRELSLRAYDKQGNISEASQIER